MSGRPLLGGSMVVIQTHGRNGQSPPHCPIIATSGGWDRQAQPGVHLDDVPSPMRRQKWQWPLLTMRRQTVKPSALRRLGAPCSTRYREGVVTNGPQGDVPARSQRLARSLATSVVSPPSSLRRIDRYDGYRVTSHYRSPTSERVERETVDVYPCVGRMVPPVCPKGLPRVRYAGVQATKTFALLKRMIPDALATVQGIITGAIKIIAPVTSRQRYQQRTGRDPVRCPHCHAEMGIGKIWHPQYGVSYDELEVIKQGKYGAQTSRADPPESRGRTLGSTACRALLSLSGLQ